MGIFDIDRPSRAYDPRTGIRFSEDEIRSLTIAVVVLTFCFSVVFSGGGLLEFLGRINEKGFFPEFLVTLVIAFTAVLTAFVLHEMGHKIAANHYGYPAAFAYSKNGLIFAAVLSLLLGVLFAAPGAVLIYGRPNKKENGIISLAGPLTNLMVAFLFGSVFIISIISTVALGIGEILIQISFYVMIINIFIGAFNMIPIGILDGAKILKWSKVVYFVMVALYIPGILMFFLINIVR